MRFAWNTIPPRLNQYLSEAHPCTLIPHGSDKVWLSSQTSKIQSAIGSFARKYSESGGPWSRIKPRDRQRADKEEEPSEDSACNRPRGLSQNREHAGRGAAAPRGHRYCFAGEPRQLFEPPATWRFGDPLDRQRPLPCNVWPGAN